MTAGLCGTPIKGTHLRVVKVDACGVPVTGTSSIVVITKGFVQVTMSPQYEDGEEYFERTADGSVCVNQKDAPTLKRFQLGVNFCEVDPSLAAYVMNARLLNAGGTPASGTGFWVAEGQPTNRFSLEVWQKVAGSSACTAGGVQRYIYHAWPNTGNTQIGDYTIENGRSTLQFTSETEAGSSSWGTGPGTGTKWLTSGSTIATSEHWVWDIVTTAPPTPSCGPIQLT